MADIICLSTDDRPIRAPVQLCVCTPAEPRFIVSQYHSLKPFVEMIINVAHPSGVYGIMETIMWGDDTHPEETQWALSGISVRYLFHNCLYSHTVSIYGQRGVCV